MDVGRCIVNPRIGVLCVETHVGGPDPTGRQFVDRPRQTDGCGLVDAYGDRAVRSGVAHPVGGSKGEAVDAFGEGQVEGVAGGGRPCTAVESVVHAGDAGALPVVGLRQQARDGHLGGLLPCAPVSNGDCTNGRSRSVNADEERRGVGQSGVVLHREARRPRSLVHAAARPIPTITQRGRTVGGRCPGPGDVGKGGLLQVVITGTPAEGK